MAPGPVVETSTDIRIHCPVAGPRPTRLTQLMQRVLGTVALPAAMGEGGKIRVEEGLQDHHHRPLAPLVLAAGVPYGPLLPSVLLAPDPLDWRCHIPIVAEPRLQVRQGVVHGLRLWRRGR